MKKKDLAKGNALFMKEEVEDNNSFGFDGGKIKFGK